MANALLMLDDGTHRWTTVPGGPADPSGKFFVMPPPERIRHEGLPFHRVGTLHEQFDPALGVKGDHFSELYHQGIGDAFVDWKGPKRKKARTSYGWTIGGRMGHTTDAYRYTTEALRQSMADAVDKAMGIPPRRRGR